MNRQRKSPCAGLGFVEVLASSAFLIILAALAIDICLLIFGASINDSACRDAARAASQAGDSRKALELAQAALRGHQTDGYFVTLPQLTSTTSPDFVFEDFAGAPPTDQTPYVTVTTKVLVKVPTPIFFYGAEFLRNGIAEFRQRYTFPLTRTKFN